MNTGIIKFMIKDRFCYFKIEGVKGSFICSFARRGGIKRWTVKRRIYSGCFIRGPIRDDINLPNRIMVSGKIWKKIYEEAAIMF